MSVVVVTRSEEQPAAVTHLAKLDNSGVAEVLIARGRSPSAQRNAAARFATGDLIYFLDDDSFPDRRNSERIRRAFDGIPTAVGVGGPSLPPLDGGWWQDLLGALFAHPLGTFAYRFRYRDDGAFGPCGDEALILANLCVRRGVFLQAGGFDERLYPNEENELIDRLRGEGGTFIRDPELVVRRPHRGSLRALARQMWTYGRGRATQTRVSPSLRSITKAGMAIALAVGPLIGWLIWATVGMTQPWVGAASTVLGPTHAAILLLAALWTAASDQRPSRLLLFPLFWLCHAAYGAGIAFGLLVPLRRSQVHESITVERLSPDQAQPVSNDATTATEAS